MGKRADDPEAALLPPFKLTEGTGIDAVLPSMLKYSTVAAWRVEPKGAHLEVSLLGIVSLGVELEAALEVSSLQFAAEGITAKGNMYRGRRGRR